MAFKMKAVEELTNTQWEEFAKAAEITVPEAQKQYQAFMEQHGADRLTKQLMRSTTLTLVREQELAARFEIDECVSVDIEVFTVEACVKGYFDSINDFRFKVTYSVSAFGQTIKKETIEISSSSGEWCNTVGALGNDLKYCFGVRPHGNHGDIYLRGHIKTWFGTSPFDFVLLHLG